MAGCEDASVRKECFQCLNTDADEAGPILSTALCDSNANGMLPILLNPKLHKLNKQNNICDAMFWTCPVHLGEALASLLVWGPSLHARSWTWLAVFSFLYSKARPANPTPNIPSSYPHSVTPRNNMPALSGL
eukprot:scaffold4783_cov19-Tisochrysis_lutea.AAC.1